MADSSRILVIDDDESICEVLRIALKREGYQVSIQTDPERGLAAFRDGGFDLVIQDIKMPHMDGLDLLRKLKEVDHVTPVVIITAFSTWDRAVQAMRLGAYDYIRKPFDMSLDVKATIRRALQSRERRTETDQSETLILHKLGFVIGYSRQMKQVWDLVRKAANTDSTCLIYGESGTGKELVARSLHFLSPRSGNQFVAINCGAIPEALLESELFGHVKGSFTDAHQDRVGLIEMAHEGTVFLDEISEMSPKLQVKLLRVLEEKEYRPVGGSKPRTADVRFITATNKDLSEEVEKTGFRRDLYYRLNVIPIALPSLKERSEDVPILSEYFLKKYSTEMGRTIKPFTDRAKKALQEYRWPGNIREMENLVQRAVALTEGDVLDVEDLFETHAPPRDAPLDATHRQLTPLGISLDERVRELEVDYFRQALDLANGNQTKAARLLGMSLSSFRHKAQKYGLSRPDKP